mmetsp:Transcript_27417/g.89742  ORF Transcript_27417/g.89742 Transcript_27417/m.89742 type:complete len:125 (+) Transcript_27417:292-666(+)
MRSSTSICLIADSAIRKTPRRAFSLARMASFMAAVSCSLSALIQTSTLVETFACKLLTLQFLKVTLDGCGTFALTLLGGLLILLATTHFRENTRFFTATLETAQGHIKRFAFFHLHLRHEESPS